MLFGVKVSSALARLAAFARLGNCWMDVGGVEDRQPVLDLVGFYE